MKYIAFINSLFPALSATFIYKEVLGLRKRGLPVKTFAIRKPPLEEISKESYDLRDTTVYLLPVNYLKLVQAHLYFVLKYPLRFLHTLCFLITRKFDNKLKDRFRTLLHFFEGILFAKLIEEQGDICHIHAHYAAHPTSVALTASMLTKLPFSFTAHAYDIWIDRLFIKDKVNAAEFVITCTAYGRQQILKNNGILNPRKITTIYHGVNTSKFSPRHSAPASKTTILHVGRLSEEKSQDNLIRACAILKQQRYNFECLIVGDGPLYSYLKDLIIQNGLEGVVKLVGKVFQENIINYYAAADMFVLPSQRENLPNVLLESLAMGVPVIATNIAGIPELIQNNKNGLLVDPNNVEALAATMKKLIDDKELTKTLRNNGRRSVCRNFEQQSMLDKIVELYRAHGVIEK